MKIARLLALLLLFLAACAEPLPPARTPYVGDWRAEKMTLAIGADGFVHYRRQSDNGNVSIDAPIKAFEGDDFLVGVGPFTTRFVVSKPPHRDGASWKMTVDGVELVKRPGPADATA